MFLATILWILGGMWIFAGWISSYIPSYIKTTTWRIYKFVIHKIMGTSELARICSGEYDTLMAYKFALSLSHTHVKLLKVPISTLIVLILTQNALEESIEDAIRLICDAKDILDENNVRLCLEAVAVVNALKMAIAARKSINYDSTNPQHEALLEELWTSLCPGVVRKGRMSDEWQDIGFQGKDPATDFRGMGIFGLEQLVYISREKWSHSALLRSQSNRGYPFTIVGINISKFVCDLLNAGKLDRELFLNPTTEAVNRVYYAIFRMFDKVWWRVRPENVLAFPDLFASLCEEVESRFNIHV